MYFFCYKLYDSEQCFVKYVNTHFDFFVTSVVLYSSMVLTLNTGIPWTVSEIYPTKNIPFPLSKDLIPLRSISQPKISHTKYQYRTTQTHYQLWNLLYDLITLLQWTQNRPTKDPQRIASTLSFSKTSPPLKTSSLVPWCSISSRYRSMVRSSVCPLLSNISDTAR